jgi:hypothetical protein
LILSRTDYHGTFTKRIKDELSRRDIAVFDSAEIETVLREAQNRKLLVMFRLVANEYDSLAWWTLLHLEAGIGSQFVNSIYDAAVQTGKRFGDVFIRSAESGFAEYPKAIKNRVSEFYTTIRAALERIEIPNEPDVRWGNWVIDVCSAVGQEPTERSGRCYRKSMSLIPTALRVLIDTYLKFNPSVKIWLALRVREYDS